MSKKLQELFFRSLTHFPERIALEDASGTAVSYAALGKMVGEKAAFLSANKIGPGTRVALLASKSIAGVATLLAVLETGAAYIPLDVTTPSERLQQILRDLDPHAFIAAAENFPSAIPCQQQLMASSLEDELSITFFPGEKHKEDLAYLLYTSGSTGIPKGVCITHENARAFTDWCLQTFPLSEKDRFSSIAPLHFDLSVFDFYVAFACGGTVVLFDESIQKNARLMSERLSEKNISVLYATPSLLSLLLNFGKIEKHSYPALKLVLFAGEIFPVPHLHALMKCWTGARFFNLYGPTETNVCAWYEIPRPLDESRTEPYPIGKMCAGLEAKISPEGELWVVGKQVTPGYWQREELNETAFVEMDGKRFYKTGDHVEMDKDHHLVYTGRLDRMIKKRGYRIEPEEVEGILLRHPDVLEAAVLPGKDAEGYTLLRAFLAIRENAGTTVLSIKQHCLSLLPAYMVPEQIHFLEALPKTSSGKVDLQGL